MRYKVIHTKLSTFTKFPMFTVELRKWLHKRKHHVRVQRSKQCTAAV